MIETFRYAVATALLLSGIVAQDLEEENGNAEEACQHLGQVLRGRRGVITSPGYQNSKNYPPNTHCVWAFVEDRTKFIRLKFLDFHVELYNDCKRDHLDIISEPINGVLMKRFCGDKLPKDVVLPANLKLRLEFHSDELYEFSGFKVEYRIENEGESCPIGFFLCKNSNCVPEHDKCNEVDDCRDGSDEEYCGHKMEPPSRCGTHSISPVESNTHRNRSIFTKRIVGGEEAIPGSWPWQIALHKATTLPSGQYCGGTLLNNFWVITAGHCVQGLSTSDIRLHIGSHSTFDEEVGELVRYPSKIFLHPKFKKILLQNDLALIKLNSPVTYSDTISPICLPSDEDSLVDGDKCYVTGWGTTYGSGGSGFLKQVMVSIMNYKECQQIHNLAKNTICANFASGIHSPCFGDSGGPLVHYRNAWFLAGVVSWGPQECGINSLPSVFTKVAVYVEWIYKTMADEHQEAIQGTIPHNAM